MDAHNYFLNGAILVAYVVIGLFFLRFWRESGDRLFAIFAAAFGVLAAERIVLSVIGINHEFRSLVYLIRLSAFVLIIWAVIDKNRRHPPSS